MKLCCVLSVSMLLLLAVQSRAYVYSGDMDTSSGYCVGEHFGRIPVGGYGYDDEKCEKVFCVREHINVHGCSPVQLDAPGCRLVSRNGHFPDCCRIHVECDDDDE
ncbi:hypothetical protein AVEN_267291-1 [Araneus ventricosus]|uniref:Single domain-containing protein n=1 Tax=Araneus ventricosus TaxID=182803 RepID=A0A4Y2DJF4_ARAVE|nr:hypothetical protein AVEN_267291-1 [Araneus ventricosus]